MAACDNVHRAGTTPGTYSECLGERLKSVHTVEGSAAVIGACTQEYPPGASLRDVQRVVELVHVQGTAGVDETYGVGNRFSGTLYNPSRDVVVTEVVIRLSIKKPDPQSAASAPAWQPPLNYSVRTTIWPQSAAQFSIPIVPFKEYGPDWGVATVYAVDHSVALGRR
jgi:hypothetical protein